MAAKTYTVLILDTGPAMCHARPGADETPLETSLKAIKLILARKMFTSPKDEVAIVLFGTEETDNELADDTGGYKHVKVMKTFACPDLELLHKVHNSIAPGNQDADFVDAIVIGAHLLNEATLGKKVTERNIVMFSNLGSPFGNDGIETILEGMKNLEVNFTIVGPDLHSEDNDDKPTDTMLSCDAKTSQQKLGEEFMKRILFEVEGQSFTFSDILQMLTFVEQKAIRQTTVFRGPLQIGSNIKINVYGYIRVKELKPDAWKKLSAPAEASPEPGSMGVVTQRSYHRNDDDDDDTEVVKDDLAKAYRYGRTLVPFLKIDEKSMKLEADKCLEVLCFTPSSCVKRYQYMGDSVVAFVPQPEDNAAAVALSAIIRALYESDKVAIVRYVFRNKAVPKVGFLRPHIKRNYECLLYTTLPFAEDIRHFKFTSLPSSFKHEPKEKQMEAVDDFIENLILSKANRYLMKMMVKTRNCSNQKLYNPYRQRLLQCIIHRSLYPDESLPEFDEAIESLLKQPDDIVASAAPCLQKLKTVFPLRVVVNDKNKMTTDNVFKSNIDLGLDDEEHEIKRQKLSSDEKAAASMNDLNPLKVTKVGTVDPVGDFMHLVGLKEANTFDEASQQLKDRIQEFILDSFKDELYPKAISCIHALRKESIKAMEAEKFNAFLYDLKTKLSEKTSFWLRLKEENISLINSGECSTVNVSIKTANLFIHDNHGKNDLVDEEMEDVDDLLETIGR
ncbi:X-ray repair cross-complementing protein 5-like [Xenia sp. Carnegie-2017]|uniref:X-ray repair cross-complementing protein 5-like n=1 Tax=Xenia sp. Carnegie-2017 TaxID=2897299 RepID=UPI001F04447D|nr:X-ray repair cross-complementing protein 5-like [Xenia sp. Carnegie-2017]